MNNHIHEIFLNFFVDIFAEIFDENIINQKIKFFLRSCHAKFYHNNFIKKNVLFDNDLLRIDRHDVIYDSSKLNLIKNEQ